MIKVETFHFVANGENFDTFAKETNEFDGEIQKFITSIEEEGHTFLSMGSVSYGRGSSTNRIKTEVVYRDNEKRKVMTEKNIND